jgi:hypothetical protein
MELVWGAVGINEIQAQKSFPQLSRSNPGVNDALTVLRQ